MISGPLPAPTLSLGSILKERIFADGSFCDDWPNFTLNGALVPVEPDLKFADVVSLKSSKKLLLLVCVCALTITTEKIQMENSRRCFI